MGNGVRNNSGVGCCDKGVDLRASSSQRDRATLELGEREEFPLEKVLRARVLLKGYQGELPRKKLRLPRLPFEREQALRDVVKEWVNL